MICYFWRLDVCSHDRAVELYEESILKGDGAFEAENCPSYKDFLAKSCESSRSTIMGEYVDPRYEEETFSFHIKYGIFSVSHRYHNLHVARTSTKHIVIFIRRIYYLQWNPWFLWIFGRYFLNKCLKFCSDLWVMRFVFKEQVFSWNF